MLGLLIAVLGSRLLITYAASHDASFRGDTSRRHRPSFALGLSLATGMIFGTLPGVIASRVKLNSLNDSGARTVGTEGGTRLRNLLVVLQVSLSFLLLIGAGLMLRSLYNLLSVDPGFKTQNVPSMELDLNWTKYQKNSDKNLFYRQVLARASTLPSVSDAAIDHDCAFE